jgi:hypothetical protein
MSCPTQITLTPPALSGFRRVLPGARWALTLIALVTSLVTHAVNLHAQDFDESDPRAVARDRFEAVMRASKSAGEPLPRFLERWLASTPEQEIALLGTMWRAWTGGGDEPVLYLAFVSDSSFDSRLDEVLPALETLHQRVPALAAQAPWQALLARAQLKAGQLQPALASARRAWALDARLCASDCAPLVRTWLRTGEVAAPTQWPALMIDPVYNPGRTECTSGRQSLDGRPPLIIWRIREIELVAAARGSDGQLAWMLREGWKAHLDGCDNVPFSLQQLLDQRHPRIVVEQGWLGLQRALQAGPGTSFDFLGVRLPLPAFECDFAADANCNSGQRPLRPASALALAEGLRAFSSHLAPPTLCPAPSDPVTAANFIALQRRFRERLEAIDALAPAAARQALRALLADPQWQPLWRDDVPSELSESLANQARAEAPEELLLMVQAFVDRTPDPLARSDSAAETLALHLLRARRPEAGLAQLQLAQQRDPQLERAQRIAQLQAGLAGADLDASLPVGTPPRPWISGQRKSDRAVSNAWPDGLGGSLDGVTVSDVVYALGGDRAVARRALKQHWVPALLQWQYAGDELTAALKRAYADAGELSALLKQVQFRDVPEAQASFDGVSLPVPDRYCVDPDCSSTQAVDAAWVVQRLRAAMQ